MLALCSSGAFVGIEELPVLLSVLRLGHLGTQVGNATFSRVLFFLPSGLVQRRKEVIFQSEISAY